jgi:PTH2 family peptidyl-tRNA hydrolase
MISKQVIVVRKDLNMPEGKLAAQVSHASMAPLIEKLRGFSHDLVTPTDTEQRLFIDLIPGDAWKDWIDGRFRKIVVYVKSEQKLLDIFNKAKEAKLPCSLIKDAGFTVFNEPTYTCVGIGPCWAEDVDKITGKLRLL